MAPKPGKTTFTFCRRFSSHAVSCNNLKAPLPWVPGTLAAQNSAARKVGYVLLAIATTPQLLARCPSCHDPSLIQLDFWQRTQISSIIWQFFCTNRNENAYRCTIEAVAERLLRSLAFCRGQKGQQPRFTKNVEDVNMSKVAFKSQLSYMSPWLRGSQVLSCQPAGGGGGGYLA